MTLTPASSDQVTVDYATLAAGATVGEDYTQASGTLTFAAGETQKTTTVTILDDTLYETGSVNGVLVELSNATGTAELVGGTTTIYLQIQDNESPPTATMENVTVDEGAGTMAFTLSLTHGIDTDIEYSAGARGLGGTATERVDYAAFFSETGSVNLKMPARQTSATFAVTILDDDVHEADETISMRWIRIGSAVATGSIDVTGTITNDDERGVEVSATELTVPEGGDVTYTVVLTSQPTGERDGDAVGEREFGGDGEPVASDVHGEHLGSGADGDGERGPGRGRGGRHGDDRACGVRRRLRCQQRDGGRYRGDGGRRRDGVDAR